jgi:hypothetical protein
MDEPASKNEDRGDRGRGLVATLVVLGTLGVTGAAAWIYFRSKEASTDAQTRQRLQRKPGARP